MTNNEKTEPVESFDSSDLLCGWRPLKKGEVIKEGDRVYSCHESDKSWISPGESVGEKWNPFDFGNYKRKST